MPLHRLLIAILAMVMALSLAACNSDSSSGGGSSTSPETTATAEPTAAPVTTYSTSDLAGTWSNFKATHEDFTHVGSLTFGADGKATYVSMPTVPKEAILGQLSVASGGAVKGHLAILLTFNDGSDWWTDGEVTGGFRSKNALHLNLGWRGTQELTK